MTGEQRPRRVGVWAAVSSKAQAAPLLDAYGWPHDLDDEEILAPLLALNLERSGAV